MRCIALLLGFYLAQQPLEVNLVRWDVGKPPLRALVITRGTEKLYDGPLVGSLWVTFASDSNPKLESVLRWHDGKISHSVPYYLDVAYTIKPPPEKPK